MIAETAQFNSFQWIEGGAVVVMCGAFLLVLKWMLHRFTKALERIEYAQHSHTVTLLTLFQALIRHDATVSGVNPASGHDDDTRDTNATRKYTAIIKSLEELQTAVVSRMNTISKEHSERITLPKVF
tara:strand:- start:985 stop:1365 length:381 start_codon:yes stop_codon:yes gene_type:complete